MRTVGRPILAAGAAFVLLAAGVVASGCEDLLQEPDTGFSKLTMRLEEVSGNGQSGAAGQALGEPIRVRLLKSEQPMPRMRVQWSVLDGAGSAEPRDTFSDEEGMTEATWILGPGAGAQKLRAAANDAVFVDFTATVVAP